MSEDRTPTTRLRIVIASPLEAHHAERIAAFDPETFEVVYEPELLPPPRYAGDHGGAPMELDDEQLAIWRGHLRSADILFDFDWHDRVNLLTNAPNVRWVQATSSGIGKFLEKTGMADSEVTFTTAAGVHAVPLAEFAVTGLLHFAKGVPDLARWQAEHRWERYTTRQLRGQRVLVVGLGEIGREVARLLHAHGVEVWAMPRSPRNTLPEHVDRVIARDELLGALPDVDGLVLACPHTDETHHLIGARELAALPETGVVVNVARGQVIDEPELIEALRKRTIGGAFLDVFEAEPLPDDNPLWDLPNTLVSPHSASTVEIENELIVELFLQNLARFRAGTALRNVFDAERSY